MGEISIPESIRSSGPTQFLQCPRSPRPSSPRRASPKADQEKGKKHLKKGQTGYPAVGIRVRKELPPFAKGAEPPPATLSPHDSPNTAPQPDSSHQPQLHPHNPTPLDEGYRSRSSSITYTQDTRARDLTQPLSFSLPFAGPSHVDLQTIPRNGFNVSEHQQPQQPFASSPSTMYNNPSQEPSRASSFDHHRGFDHTVSSFETPDSYLNGSSPFNNSSAPISTASSPYASTNGTGPPPQTPSYSTGSTHHPSPPVFGQPPSATPQTFYHAPTTYDTAFGLHDPPPQQAVPQATTMDVMHDMGAGSTGMLGTSHTNLAYDKPPAMYDGKQDIDTMSPIHYQSLSNQSVNHQHSLIGPSAAVHHPWNTMQALPPPQIPVNHNGQPFWDGALYYNH